MSLDSFNTTAQEVAKVAPPLTVSGLTLGGLTVPELIQVATLIYTLLLGLDKIYMMFMRYREKRSAELKEIKSGRNTEE